MKKNSILYNISILLSAGLIVKTLGLVNKIILARILSLEGMTMYSMMMPTITLFLGLATFSLAPVITTIVSANISKKPYSNRDLMVKAFVFATGICILISIVHLVTNYFICHYLLRMDELFIPFLFFIPIYFFTSYGGILKGYYHGHNKMNIYAQAQILEQVVRIVSTIFVIAFFTKQSIEAGVISAIVTLWIGEAIQFGYLALRIIGFTSIKKTTNVVAHYQDFLIPSATLTGNRFISSIAYFFEPIIFTYAFFLTGMDSAVANKYFGILHGYVIPIILTASFITASIQTAILPPLAKAYKNNNQEMFRKILEKAMFLSFIPAVIVSYVLYFYAKEIMLITYKTTVGVTYLKIMALPCFICYFEGVFSSALLAQEKSKQILFLTIIGNIVKLSLIFILVRIPYFNATGLVYSFVASSILTTVLGYFFMRTHSGYKIKLTTLILSTLFFISVLLLGKLYIVLQTPMILAIVLVSIYIIALVLIYYKKHFTNFHIHES